MKTLLITFTLLLVSCRNQQTKLTSCKTNVSTSPMIGRTIAALAVSEMSDSMKMGFSTLSLRQLHPASNSL